MGASRYVGRVGGLAVALGAGTVVFFAGQGVAAADSNTGGTQPNSGPHSSGPQRGTDSASRPGPGKIKITGRHRESADSPTVASIAKRLTDARDKAVAAGKRDVQSRPAKSAATATTGSDESSLLKSGDTARKAKAIATALSESAAARRSAVAHDAEAVAAQVQTAAKQWLASPRVAAARAAKEVAPAGNLWTPPSAAAVKSSLPTLNLKPLAAPQVQLPSVLSNLLGGNASPTLPRPAVSPADALLLAATRRELSTAAITYNPLIGVDNGVITGINVPFTLPPTPLPVSDRGLPLSYSVLGSPTAGGKVVFDSTTGNFSFLPFRAQATGSPYLDDSFRVLIAETTPFVTALESIPLAGSLVRPIVVQLYQVPILNDVLAPIIGYSTIQTVVIDVADATSELAPGTPIAFTTMVKSFDGALISVNWFPATGLGPNDTAPTLLNGPGLGGAGNIDPNSVLANHLVPGLMPLRDGGYNVVTWDPRGEFASGGILNLDSPAFEGQDVIKILDWVETLDQTGRDGDDDPLIGMVGGSYGGGIQLVTAGIDGAADPRIDAIVPGIAWNTLTQSLYTNGAFKTAFSALLLLDLVEGGARINPQIYAGIITGALTGTLTPGQYALLAASGPNFLNPNNTIPTLFIQGTVDVLFPLTQQILNAQEIGTAPEDVHVIWFCGGHGVCLNGFDLDQQDDLVLSSTMAWLDKYVKGEDVDTGEKFTWVDQNGNIFTSTTMPTIDPDGFPDGDFYGDSFNATPSGGSGFLGIVPILGGSGPQSLAGLPVSLGLAAPAQNAINVDLDVPEGTHIVGAPTLDMTYSGIGTSRSVYAQIVDKKTGLVVGNLVTPIPVTLNGQEQHITIPMEAIAFTTGTGADASDLELQIVGSAVPYLNLTQFGYINVHSVNVTLPTALSATPYVPASEPLEELVAV